MKNLKFGVHTFSLCVIFLLGNTILTLPLDNINIFTFITFSAILSLILYFSSWALIKCCEKLKFIFFSVCLLLCILAAWGALGTFLDFYNFLNQVQMAQCQPSLLAGILLCTIIIFTAFKLSAIYKYCLFAGVLCGIAIILCFLSGIKNYDFSSAKLLFGGNIFSLKMFFNYFLPFGALPLLFYWQDKNFYFKSASLSIVSGFLTLFIIAGQTVLTLGLSAEKFSYLKAISVISTSSLFSRLDGLAFFIFFVSCMVKITVLIKLIVLSIKHLICKNPRFC